MLLSMRRSLSWYQNILCWVDSCFIRLIYCKLLYYFLWDGFSFHIFHTNARARCYDLNLLTWKQKKKVQNFTFSEISRAGKKKLWVNLIIWSSFFLIKTRKSFFLLFCCVSWKKSDMLSSLQQRSSCNIFHIFCSALVCCMHYFIFMWSCKKWRRK